MEKSTKRIILLLTLVASVAQPSMSQVYATSNLEATNEIVRDIDGTRSIIYAFDVNSSTGLFALDDGSGTIRYLYLPQKILVNDVETDGKNIYFCGTDGTYGTIGHFDWDDVYNHAGKISYIPCDQIFNGVYYVYVYDYTKLDFFFENGQVVLSLIGHAIIDQYSFLKRTVISSARMLPPNSWEFCHFYNKDGEITYTDIAALDDVVAAVGNHSGSGCYWKAFRKISHFTQNPLGGNSATQIGFNTTAEGPSLIVHTDLNRAAVAHHGDGTLTVHRLEEDLVSERPVAYEKSYHLLPLSTLPYSIIWTLNDLRYNKELYILEYADHNANGNIEGWVMRLPNTTSPTNIDAKHKFVGVPLSMTINSLTHVPFMSGHNSFKLTFYDQLNMTNSTSCDHYQSLTPSYWLPSFEDIIISFDSPLYLGRIYYHQPILATEYKNTICN